MENNNKQRRLEELIGKMSYGDADSKTINGYICEFRSIFLNDFQYQEQIISRELFKVRENPKLNLLTLTYNLKKVQKKIKNDHKWENDYKRNTGKSYRYKENNNNDDTILSLIHFIQIEIENIHQHQFDDSITEVRLKEELINKQYEKIQEILRETKHTKTELTTILGIFTAIALGFIGEMVFSSSMLSNIGKAKPYEVAFTISALFLCFINLIFVLVLSLYRIVIKNNYDEIFDNERQDTNNDSQDINRNNNQDKIVEREKSYKNEIESLKNTWVTLNVLVGVITIITFILWVNLK